MVPKKSISELLKGKSYDEITDLIGDLPYADDDTAIIEIEGHEYALIDEAGNLLTSHQAREIMEDEQTNA